MRFKVVSWKIKWKKYIEVEKIYINIWNIGNLEGKDKILGRKWKTSGIPEGEKDPLKKRNH